MDLTQFRYGRGTDSSVPLLFFFSSVLAAVGRHFDQHQHGGRIGMRLILRRLAAWIWSRFSFAFPRLASFVDEGDADVID